MTIKSVNDLKPLMMAEGKASVLTAANQMRLTGKFVEVGTYTGDFAERILRFTACEKLFCVDPYESYDSFKDGINELDLNSIFLDASNRLSMFGERVEFIRSFSEESSKNFADQSLDCVYIDANHQCEFVTRDLAAWYPKLRSGGLLCGDDVHDWNDDQRDAKGDIVIVWQTNDDGSPRIWGTYGVLAAIRRFAAELGREYLVHGGQFFLIKP